VVSLNMVGAYMVVCGLTSFYLSPTTLLLCALILLLQMAKATESFDLRHKSAPWLLALWIFTIFVAASVGARNYHQNFAPYKAAKDGQEYAGIDARDRSPTYMDAGKISFKDGALLDESRAVGLGIFGGMYCAAPVISRAEVAVSAPEEGTGALNVDAAAAGNPAETSFVQFWAVGMDCCESRGSFTCDSAASPQTHGGVVLQQVMEEELNILMHTEGLRNDGYLAAVQASCALHGLETPSVPILMHWAEQPNRLLLQWYQWSLLVWLVSSIAYGIVFTVSWFLLEFTFDDEFGIDLEEALTGRPHHERPSPQKGLASGSLEQQRSNAPFATASSPVASQPTRQPNPVARLLEGFRPQRAASPHRMSESDNAPFATPQRSNAPFATQGFESMRR